MPAAQDKKYFYYLDALRCLAFLAVFYAHTGNIFFGATVTNAFPLNLWHVSTVYGGYGVNFFFVLSGFLITYLLVKEKAASGRIAIRRFYIKRVLRIWPVYFANLLFAAFILPLLISPHTYALFGAANPHLNPHTFWYFVFFAGNIAQGLGIGFTSLSIGVLWSVGVEEQFYLVWPWIVKWFSTKRLILMTLALISLSLLYKYLFGDDRIGNYYLPWSVGMDLAFGALLGIFFFQKKYREIVLGALGVIGASCLVISGALLSAYLGVHGSGNTIETTLAKSEFIDIMRLLKTPMIDAVFALIIFFFARKAAALNTAAKHPLLASLHIGVKRFERLLAYLGRISYGLYAYHTICLMLTIQILYGAGFLTATVDRLHFFATTLFAFVFSIAIASLSYRFMEQKFLALKEKAA